MTDPDDEYIPYGRLMEWGLRLLFVGALFSVLYFIH